MANIARIVIVDNAGALRAIKETATAVGVASDESRNDRRTVRWGVGSY